MKANLFVVKKTMIKTKTGNLYYHLLVCGDGIESCLDVACADEFIYHQIEELHAYDVSFTIINDKYGIRFVVKEVLSDVA